MLELEPFHYISSKINAFGKNVMQELNLKNFKSNFIWFLSLPFIHPYHLMFWKVLGFFVCLFLSPPLFFLIC